ncbi:hypothetical protein ACFQVD_37085 [Streptosporangium amethystogenes subsp. fukuiense]|uniref:Uncharacterized protein n=1 Tax=Streptosporangium amethystogenes subsp. fukuiense TaxID=698418 RepID=A0ABW2TAU5_9ACTN
MPDFGEFLTTPIPLPFGWGSLPFWFLLFMVVSGVVVVLGAMSKESVDGKAGSRKHDHAEIAARGSLLGGRGQVAGVIVAALALVVSTWMGRTQWEQEVQQQEQQSREEAQREEQRAQREKEQQEEERMREHASFVRRVAVLAYPDPAGMKMKIRNANPAAASVLVLSRVADKDAMQNAEVLVAPCSEGVFLMLPSKVWSVVVRKGGLDWTPGSDPTPASQDFLFQTYGASTKDGREEIRFSKIGTVEESISDCAS